MQDEAGGAKKGKKKGAAEPAEEEDTYYDALKRDMADRRVSRHIRFKMIPAGCSWMLAAGPEEES